MAASKVDICNKALGHIGAKKIVALTENTQPAIELSKIYDTVLRSLLRATNWNFCNVSETLALLSDVVFGGWAYAHQYPGDCMFIRKVFADGTAYNPTAIEFEEGTVVASAGNKRVVATNVTPAYVRYSKEITDPDFFDPMFAETLGLALACEVAYTLTKSEAVTKRVQALFVQALSEARRRNTQEKKIDGNSTSSFVSARG